MRKTQLTPVIWMTKGRSASSLVASTSSPNPSAAASLSSIDDACQDCYMFSGLENGTVNGSEHVSPTGVSTEVSTIFIEGPSIL